MIMAVMMIPGTVTMIGFYQMAYKIGMINKLSVLIIPSIYCTHERSGDIIVFTMTTSKIKNADTAA